MQNRVEIAGIVEDGYDEIAQIYHEQRNRFKSHELLSRFSFLLPPGGHVLDAGCGAGVPVARFLVDAGFSLTGIDVSSSIRQVTRHWVIDAGLSVTISEVLELGDEEHYWVMARKTMQQVTRAGDARVSHQLGSSLAREGSTV